MQLMTTCEPTMASMFSYAQMSQFIYVKTKSFFFVVPAMCFNANILVVVSVDMIIDLASCPFTYSLHIWKYVVVTHECNAFIYRTRNKNKTKNAHRRNRFCLCIVVLHNFEFELLRCCFVFFSLLAFACRAILNAMCVHACGQKKNCYIPNRTKMYWCVDPKKKNAVASPLLSVLCYE